MNLNPSQNLFSVAPLNNGQVIMVARSMALKGGISREAAVNLLAWLVIATGAKPDEIVAEIRKAYQGLPESAGKQDAVVVGRGKVVQGTGAVGIAPPTNLQPKGPTSVNGVEVKPQGAPLRTTSVNGVTTFIGEIDAEEKQALAEAVEQAGQIVNAAADAERQTGATLSAWEAVTSGHGQSDGRNGIERG